MRRIIEHSGVQVVMCKVNSALRRDDPPFMDCEMLFYYH
jgi:hypothetical protein